jgi:3-dehydroquinate synthase
MGALRRLIACVSMSRAMSSLEQQFAVEFAFPVYFTRDVWDPDNPVFVNAVRRREPGREHRVLPVIDSNVAAGHPTLERDLTGYFGEHAGAIALAGLPVTVPGGEAIKNDFSQVLRLLEAMDRAHLDRQSFVAVIGGGSVLDVVSFASAIAHRGVRTIRLPTTVLSQGDSGFAVKNGVNFFGKKNFVGTFVPPFAVINDARLLESLKPRDRVSGVSEAIKVALLKDPSFFATIEAAAPALAEGDLEVLTPVIRRSAELHLAHICGNGDPFEQGSARPLDFGHWSAHKLESLTNFRLGHGEAVAIGMALDVCYSTLQGDLPLDAAERILSVIGRVGLPMWDEALITHGLDGVPEIIAGLREFREHLGGSLHVTLLRGIGDSFEVTAMDEGVIAASIRLLTSRAMSQPRQPR